MSAEIVVDEDIFDSVLDINVSVDGVYRIYIFYTYFYIV